MADVHALFWFDVEDCTVPQSDDCAKRLAWILEKHGVRGTFKVVGQKARVLEQRIRYDVVDALRRHDVGFHSNWHGLRPQIAEYLGPLDWHEGAAEFERREGPGLEDVQRLFGPEITTYGQPGSNWAPQPFPVLRKWGIPTYVSGFGYIGVDCQPFRLGGILCTSHMYGRRLSGEEQRHLMGLNFELGKPGELEKHRAAFARSLEQLSGAGGLISILNHPCTLVLEEWFSTYMKPRELTEAGYAHFEEFVAWAMAQPRVKPTCASQLPALYPDRAVGRRFRREEIAGLAAALTEAVTFQRLGDAALSAAECFGLVTRSLEACVDGAPPASLPYAPVMNPTAPAPEAASFDVPWAEFRSVTRSVARHLYRTGEVPASVAFQEGSTAPASYLAAAARVLPSLLKGEDAPERIPIRPAPCRFEEHVDEEAARAGWKSVMLPPGFEAPKLVEQARLLAWTLKPALLVA